jgi:hypothetical protein
MTKYRPQRKKVPTVPGYDVPLAKMLDIHRTPDEKRRNRYTPRVKSRDPRLKGVGVCAFWAQLFELNEQLPKGKKMTDAEIFRQVKLHYPKSPGVIAIEKRAKTVHYYRYLYNKGVLTGSIPPKVTSVRYFLD